MATEIDWDAVVPFEDVEPIQPQEVDWDSVRPVGPSSEALRERLQFNLREDYGPDQGGLIDQALLGIGQGISGLAGAAGGVASFFGADETGRGLSDYARRKREEYEELGDVLGVSPAAQITRSLSGQVAQQAPLLAAGLFSGGSIPVMAGAAGFQSLGQVQDEASFAYEQQGFSPDEARFKARGPAALAGAITGALTRYIPGGMESLMQQFARGELSRAGLRAAVRNVGKQAALEYPEEALDEFAQGLIAKTTYDPDRPWGEIFRQANDAGALGILISGGVGAVGTAASGLSNRGFGEEPEYEPFLNERAAGPFNPFRQTFGGAVVPHAIRQEAALRREAMELGRSFEEPEIVNEPLAPQPQPVMPIPQEPVFPVEDAPFESRPLVPADDDLEGERMIRRLLGEPELEPEIVSPQPQIVPETPPVVSQTEPIVSPSPEVVSPTQVPTSPIIAVEAPIIATDAAPAPSVDLDAPSVAETEDVLYHGTTRPFERFEAGVPDRRGQKKVDRFYFSSSPTAPINIAQSGRGVQEVNLAKYIGDIGSASESEMAEALPDLASDLKIALKRGQKMMAMNDDGSMRAIKTDREIEEIIKRGNIDEIESIQVFKKGFSPRVLKAIIKGKTLDLTNLSTIPKSLKVAMEKEGVNFDRMQPYNAYQAFEKSTALVEWARKNGFNKIKIPENYETRDESGASVIVLPEAIGDFNDIGIGLGERGSLAPEGQPTGAGVVASASGIQNIRTLIADSALSTDAKFVAQKILDVAQRTGLDSSKLTIELTDSLPAERAGSIIGTIIRLTQSADARVLPHEVAHLLELMLPPQELAAIEATRLANIPANAPDSVRSGTMTTQQFIDAKLDRSLYPFINRSEYLAHFFSNKFAQDQLAARDAGLLQRIQMWLKELWDAVKSKFRDRPAMEQIYRDLVDGKYALTPEVSAGVTQERGGFQTTASGALAEAELQQTAEELKLSGEEFIVQSEAPRFVYQAEGVFQLPARSQRKFAASDFQGIYDQGITANGQETAQQIQARSTPARNEFFAGIAAQQVRRVESKLTKLIADGQAALAELNSQPVQRRIQRLQKAELESENRRIIRDDTQAAIETAVKEAEVFLAETERSDLEQAAIEGQIKTLRDVQGSTVAMERTLDDIVNTLMASPEGRTALQAGTARDINTIYRDLKSTVKQPTQGSRDIVSVASFLLSKNIDLRDAILTNLYAADQRAQAVANAGIKSLFDRLKKDPAKTIETLMRQRERLGVNATKAEFLFLQRQKQLTKELEGYYERMRTGQVADAVLKNQQWVAHRNDVYDRGGYRSGKPIEPFSQGTIIVRTPISGQEIEIGANQISDSTQEITRKLRSWSKAMTEFQQWLAIPQNQAADPAVYRTNEQILEVLEDYFNASLLGTGQRSPFYTTGFGQLKWVIENSGSRITSAARSALGRMDVLSNRMDAWVRDTRRKLAVAQRAARTSHGFDNLDTAESIVRYRDTVFGELANRNQRSGGPKAGDTLMSGERVTREDMDYLKAVSSASKELFDLVRKHDRVTVSDVRGLPKGEEAFRKELATSEFTMPRDLRSDLGGDANIQAASRAFTAYSQSKSPQALTDLEAALKTLWEQHGKYLVSERNTDYAKPTIFDGIGGPFQLIARAIRQNPNAYPTYDDLIAGLSNYSSKTQDEIRDIVGSEFGRIIHGFYKAVAPSEESGVTILGAEPKSFLTTARTHQLAPSSFYRTGWTTDDEILGAANSGLAIGINRITDSLEEIRKDLGRQKAALESRAKQLKGGTKAAISAQRIAQRNGEAYSDWQNLEPKIAMIENAIRELQNKRFIENPGGWSRLGSVLVASAVGNSITTLRNVAFVYPYRALRNAGASRLNAFLGTLGFTQGQRLALLPNLAWGFGKGIVVNGLEGLYKGTVAGIQEKSLRAFWQQLMRGIINELGNATPRRTIGFKAMLNDGIVHLPDQQAEFDNRMADILYAGALPSVQATGGQKAAMAAAATFENTLGAVANAIFPVAGDVAVNTALSNFENSRLGTNAVFGAKIRQLLRDWQASPTRTFDFQNPNSPDNIISAKELHISTEELANFRRMFSSFGRSFDAKVVDYMARVQRDPKEQFLTPQEINRVVEYLINNANRKTFGNTVRWLNSNLLVKHWIAPLLHWNARQFSEFMAGVSVPVEGQKAVASEEELKRRNLALWGMVGTATIIAMAAAGGGSALMDDLIARLVRYQLYGAIAQNKLPWDYDGDQAGMAQRWAGYSMESVPFLSWLGTLLLPQNTPARASMDPSLFMFSKIMEALSLAQRTAVTKDVQQGAVDFSRGFMPQDVRIVTSRLESQTGRLEQSNFRNLMRRFGPEDIKRPKVNLKALSGTYTELSPFSSRMANAAYNEDIDELRQLFKDTVATARELKRVDPERTAEQIFQRGNPTLQVFERLPSKKQYDKMLADMSETQRKQFIASKERFQKAANALGINTAFWDETPTRQTRDSNPLRSSGRVRLGR